MGNRIKLRRGATAPSPNNLEDYELGYSINENQLYIKVPKEGQVEGIIKNVPDIPRNIEFTTELIITSADVSSKPKQFFFITNDVLKNKVAAIIDVDYLSITNNDYIKFFRNLDLIEAELLESDLTTNVTLQNTIKLKINGNLPNANDVASGIKIPIKVLVIK